MALIHGRNGHLATMNITLPNAIKVFAESQARKEGFGSVSEYLHALICEAQARQAKEELEAELLEGLQSPAIEMTDADWTSLRQRIYDRSPELRDRG